MTSEVVHDYRTCSFSSHKHSAPSLTEWEKHSKWARTQPPRQPQPSKGLVLLLDLDRSEFLKCACFIKYAVCRVLRVLFKNLTKLLDSVGFKNLFHHLCTFESICFFFFFLMRACGIRKIGLVFVILFVYILVWNTDVHQLTIAIKMKSCTSCALPLQSAGTVLLGLKRRFIVEEVCVGGS